jgi:CheY-like chemotaxis protein
MQDSPSTDIPYLLFIEDNDAEIRLAKEALSELKRKIKVEFINTSQLVLTWIDSMNQDNAIKPKIIFLDINMPGINGLQLLGEFKKHNILRTIPVIVFSNSISLRDVNASYKEYANSFIKKPLDFLEFINMLDLVLIYWLDLVVQAD